MNLEIYLPEVGETQPKRKKSESQGGEFVVPGQLINTEAGFLRGHGTFEEEKNLYASVNGIVEKTNKLVSVKPLKSRYQGEVGDIVVGRVAEVQQRLWRVDVNGRQDALLMLSAVNLPGGVLRRRTTSDELQMRSVYVENDLISAEVQQIHSDGALALHTRSVKYGKLLNGQMVTIPSVLIKRVKNHFYSFSFGVDVILGNNGNIWITTESSKDTTEERERIVLSVEAREKICRVRNSIVALATFFIPVYPDTISDTFHASIQYKLAPKDMLRPDVILKITRDAAKRISSS